MNSGIGDINSQDKGSGARLNEGKPNWSLMPIQQVCWLMNCNAVMEWDENTTITLNDLVDKVAWLQMEGTHQSTYDLLKWSMAYLVDRHAGYVRLSFEEVIRVWEHGESKYAAFNWMKGMPWSAVLACYMRHIMWLHEGEHYDQESGQHHGAHLVCNAMMLCHFVDYFTEGNDLPVKWFL